MVLLEVAEDLTLGGFMSRRSEVKPVPELRCEVRRTERIVEVDIGNLLSGEERAYYVLISIRRAAKSHLCVGGE